MTVLSRSIQIYLKRDILIMLFLGFGCGIPLALVISTLSSWLTTAGIDIENIGLFAMVTTPYALKFLWSPLIDQTKLPVLSRRMGRRRSWMLFTQILLIALIVIMGNSDPTSNITLFAIIALAVSFTSATQDIVVDAFRVETLDEEDQGAGAAAYVFGFRIALLVAGAGTLILADQFSWAVAYMAMAALILIAVVTTLIARKPKDELDLAENRPASVWFREGVVDPFAEFMKRNGWVLILAFVLFYKLGDAMAAVMTYPFFLKIGFTLTEIGSVSKITGFIAGVLGAMIGGVIVKELGLIKSLWICGLFQMFSNLIFAVLAITGPELYMLVVTISIENLASGMGTAAFVAYLSALCNVHYTATQYALLSSVANVSRTFLSSGTGFLAEGLGWIGFFLFTTAAAVPGLVLLYFVVKKAGVPHKRV